MRMVNAIGHIAYYCSPRCQMWYQRVTEMDPPKSASTTVQDTPLSKSNQQKRQGVDGEEPDDSPAQFRRVRMRCGLKFQNPGSRFSPPLDHQSINYYDVEQRSPSIEVVRAPVSFSDTSPSSPSEYPCLYPNCGYISSRAHDLKRHYMVHLPPAVEELLDCKYEWCGRTGAHGFKREDHRKEHYRKVHKKESEYPKTSKRGTKRSER